MRVTNDRHIVTSEDGGPTSPRFDRGTFDRGTEVSGYHQVVRRGFLMPLHGLYAAGRDAARIRDLRFTATGS